MGGGVHKWSVGWGNCGVGGGVQEAGALVGGNVVASLVVLPGEMPQNSIDIAE